MSTGTVEAYLEDRGFGFIRPDSGGDDIFVHIRSVANRDVLKGGDRVAIEMVDDPKTHTPRADRVRVL
jgi:cold shock protein